MLEEIKNQAIDLQIARVGPNCTLEQIFPDNTDLADVISHAIAGVDTAAKLDQRSTAYKLAVGRLMHIASQHPPKDWEGTGYAHFTEFQSIVLAPLIKSHGSRFSVMALYRDLRGIPVEDLQECPMGNLAQIAGIIKGGVSEAQKAELVEMAAKPKQEFQQALEDSGMLAPGEAFGGTLTIHGTRGKVEELRGWLNAHEGPDIDNLLDATAEYDSSHPAGPNLDAPLEAKYSSEG